MKKFVITLGSAIAALSMSGVANAASFVIAPGSNIGTGVNQGSLTGNFVINAAGNITSGSITTGAAGGFGTNTYTSFVNPGGVNPGFSIGSTSADPNLTLTFSTLLTILGNAAENQTFTITPGFANSLESVGGNARAITGAITITAIPFEFSPLGLVALGGAYYFSKKNKKAKSEISA